MARIPTLDLPQVSPSGQGAPAPRPVGVGGFDSLTRGAQVLAQGVGSQLEKAASESDARAAAAKKQAREAEVLEADNNWTKYRTERKYGRRGSGSASQDAGDAAFDDEPAELPGYFNLQGDEAFKAAPQEFQAIEKRRQALADDMADEEARQLFLTRTADTLEGDRREIESYAGKQRRAGDLATLATREETALEAIRANPNSFVEVTRQTAALDEAQRRFGLSAEHSQARVDDWRRKAAATQVVAQLNGGADRAPDWAAAEKTLEAKRQTLGEATAAELGGQILKVKADAGAEAAAAAVAKAATDPQTGRINDARALELLEQADIPPEARKKAADRLEHKLLVNERVWKERVSNSYDRAFSVYLHTRSLDDVPPATRLWLQDHAPKEWDELEQKQARDRDRARRLLRGEHNEGETADERLALVELQSDIVRNPDKYANMSPAEFNLEWGARLSPSGYRTGGKSYADASKGDRLSDGEFSGYVNNLVDTNPRFTVHNPADQREKLEKGQLADSFRADFGEARRAFKEKEKRNPTMSEVQSPEFQATIWRNTLKRSGIELGMQLPELDFTDTPPIRKVVKYKLSPDKTKRVPVYDDGSFGDEEPVR